jgi:hypothetical protein
MGVKLALIGGDDCVPDPPRQVNIGRREKQRAALLADGHDPLKRMLLALCPLRVSYKFDDFLLVLGEETSAQPHFARRVVIVRAMAGGTDLVIEPFMLFFRPLPAPAQIDGAALRAKQRTMGLLARFIGIVQFLFDEVRLDLIAARRLAV